MRAQRAHWLAGLVCRSVACFTPQRHWRPAFAPEGIQRVSVLLEQGVGALPKEGMAGTATATAAVARKLNRSMSLIFPGF